MRRSVPSMAPGRRGFDVLADKVLAAMELKSVGVGELAERSGVSRVVLSAWLNGRRPMRADYLAAVLGALDLVIRPRR